VGESRSREQPREDESDLSGTEIGRAAVVRGGRGGGVQGAKGKKDGERKKPDIIRERGNRTKLSSIVIIKN